jgi:hypothetical protein
VEAVTLDRLVADGLIPPERVGLLWIDAQKHEARILAGASRLIEAGVPIVFALRLVTRDDAGARRWAGPAATRASVIARLTAHYTDVVELRGPLEERKRHPIGALGDVVDSSKRNQDLLLVSR